VRNINSNRLSFYVTDMFGAEGDEVDPDSQVEDVIEADDDEPEVYDKAYVERLRREAADRRVKAKEEAEARKKLEAELAKIKKAEMDDVERLQAELEEAKAAEAEALAAASSASVNLLNERIRNTVYREAVDAGFQDPEDALSMISQDDILEDGDVSTREVRKKLKSLADKKPYLLKRPGPGDGDGGTRGTPPDPDTFKGKVEKYKEQLRTTGRVGV